MEKNMLKLLKILIDSSKVEIENVYLKYFDNKTGIKNDFDIKDFVIMSLYEEIVEKIVSLRLLIDHNRFDSCGAVSRSIFECEIYLFYILQKNTKKRGEAFFYNSKIVNANIVKNILEEKSLQELAGFNAEILDFIEAEYNKMDINGLIQKKKNILDTKKNSEKWYNETGKTDNFFKLCKMLKFNDYYQIFYKQYSNEIHGANAHKRLIVRSDTVSIITPQQSIETYVVALSALFREIMPLLLKHYNRPTRNYERAVKEIYKIMRR